MKRQSIVIIIPALNPDNKLIKYVSELLEKGYEEIILVDDGSDSDHKNVFDELKKEGCRVLSHAINMGKGRALKNAFNYYLSEYDLNFYKGVITVDSDGQHSVDDVVTLTDMVNHSNKELIIGVRDFDADNVPFKSKFGNKLTKCVIKLLYGGSISDTQTGLRAIPNRLLYNYLTLSGERFEYETTMLINTLQDKGSIKECPIKTIYLNENKGTHFRPIQDSIAIYSIILGTFIKYVFSSLSSSLIDLGFFAFFSAILSSCSSEYRIGFATFFARVLSSFFNYFVNKNIVFGDKSKYKITLVKYYSLCIMQMVLSGLGVYGLNFICRIPELISKVIVDTILFFVSYQIQRRIIFNKR